MILLASPSLELLHRWERALHGFRPLLATDQVDAVRTSLLGERPQILLVDFDLPGLDTPKAIAQVATLNAMTSIVVLSGPISEQTELNLFKAGARGYCRNDIDPQLLKRVVVSVELGELWIRRSLMRRLLDELGVRSSLAAYDKRAVIGRLAYLTAREHEIASLVGSGGTNKEIAKRLDISERTVKAHLTEIFRKLGIADRLKLALLLASNTSA